MSHYLKLLQGAVLVMQGLKTGLNGGLVQGELPVQLYSLCKLVQGGGRTAQGSCVALEVLMQGLQLLQGDGIQQACEVCPPGLAVTHECLWAYRSSGMLNLEYGLVMACAQQKAEACSL